MNIAHGRGTDTPNSNTGLNSQSDFESGIDWLDLTFRNVPDREALDQILSEYEALASEQIDFSPSRAVFNGRQWDGSGRGLRGTMVWFAESFTKDGCDRTPAQLKIAMSGRVLADVDPIALKNWLVSRAATNELDCTRFDICLDDRDRFVPLWKITEARKSGNFFNASDWVHTESGKRGQDIGTTIYFGSAKSSKRLRIYDKEIESQGKRKGIRWEVEYRKKLAREALYQWLQEMDRGTEQACRWMQNLVIGCIDFRNRSGDDPNRNRCELLDWYSALIQKLRATPATIRIAVVEQTMQRSIDWVIRSVAPSLAAIRSVLDVDFETFMTQTITEGGERLSNIRRKLIDATDKQQLCY